MYAALFNASYVPNPLERSYMDNPPKFLSPYFLAGTCSNFLFGVFINQVVNYFSAFGHTDPWLQQFHVGTVILMTIFKMVQIYLTLWKREVSEWGNFNQLTQIEPATKITSLSSAVVTVTVQIFFINRCFRLSGRNYFVLIPTSLVCALSLAASLWITATMPVNFANKDESFIQASRVFPAASVTTDALITLFSMYYLLRARRSAISRTTETMVSRLLRVTLQSALPPLITAVLSASFTGQTYGPYVFLFLSNTPLLQAFSMMYTLNCRFQIRMAASAAGNISEDNTVMRWGHSAQVGTGGADVTVSKPNPNLIKLQNVSVNVTRTIESRHDPEGNYVVEEDDQSKSGWYNGELVETKRYSS